MIRVRKLDRYVAQTFVGPFVLCLLGFIGLYVVVDFFINIEDFLKHDTLFETVRLTVRYYLVRIPSLLAQTMPLLSVTASAICLIRLHQTNETLAMRSSGVSARRISAPILLCAGGLMVLAALNQELLVPSLQDPLLVAERDAKREGWKRVRMSHVVDRDGRLVLISTYDPKRPLPTLTDIRIGWDDTFGVHHERRARRAFAPTLGETWYMEGVRTGPERFTSADAFRVLTEYRHAGDRSAKPLQARDETPFPTAYDFGAYTETDEGWPVAENIEVIDPSGPEHARLTIRMMVWAQNHWLRFGAWEFRGIDPKTNRLDESPLPDGEVFVTSIKPANIEAGEFKRASTMMTIPELAELSASFNSPKFQQRCWVIIWNRIAFPAANVILVLLVLPFVFRQTGTTGLVAVSLALLLALLYMAANVMAVDVAQTRSFPARSPVLAGLAAGTLPTLAFALVAARVFGRMDDV